MRLLYYKNRLNDKIANGLFRPRQSYSENEQADAALLSTVCKIIIQRIRGEMTIIVMAGTKRPSGSGNFMRIVKDSRRPLNALLCPALKPVSHGIVSAFKFVRALINSNLHKSEGEKHYICAEKK
jgi:hypothetical protein